MAASGVSQGKPMRIGLFDSGLGGLSVLNELKRLPFDKAPEFVYFGDTLRCPYGDRRPEEIQNFVRQIVTWLGSQSVDAVVMACNTSAACALDVAEDASPVPVFDLIRPTAHYLAEEALKTGILATSSTVRSAAFARAIHELNPKQEVVQIACPDLVPIVEGGKIDDPGTPDVLMRYLRPLLDAHVEAIVLGCTHYPFLAELIRDLIPKEVRIIDPASILTQSLVRNRELGLTPQAQAKLRPFEAINQWTRTDVQCTLFVSGPAETFTESVQRCLGYVPGTVCGITLDHLAGISPRKHSIGRTSLPSSPLQEKVS